MLANAANIEADNLAQLALRAATELDRLERKGSSDLNAVTKFVEALSSLSSAGTGQMPAPLFLDPISSEMLSEAVKSTASNPVHSLDELYEELVRVTSAMSTLSQAGAQKEALKQFKAFCLFIHEFVQRNRMTCSLNEKGVFDYDHSFAG